MANKQVVFTDRIVGVSIQNGLVRIELATIAGPAKTKEGKDGMRMDITHQLVMPIDAFAAGFNMQQKLVNEIAKQQQKRAAKSGAKAEGKDAAPAA
ncbi:hypothetical protein [Aquabacterium humicola]|uniref:hypothetical protein n=1 Tax=Aquabacterium humicola TaxID=3237377 RepID=UPI002543DB9E|nr:hypothetical protein [Rubrivivax pictus]